MKRWKKLALVVLLFGLGGAVYILASSDNSDFVNGLKLKIVMISSPVGSMPEQRIKEACEAYFDSEEHNDVAREWYAPLYEEKVVKSSTVVKGCIRGVLSNYNSSSDAKQAIETLSRAFSNKDAWEVHPLKNEPDSYILSTEISWVLGGGFLGTFTSPYYIIIVREYDRIVMISLIVSNEEEFYSPGMRITSQEVIEYAYQVRKRMRWLFGTE